MKTNQPAGYQTPINSWLSYVRNLRYLRLPQPIVTGLMIVLTIILGVGLGMIMRTPAYLTVLSIFIIAFYLVIVVSNPIGGIALWLILYPYTEENISITLGEGIPDLTPTRFMLAFLIAILLGRAATGQHRFPRITKLDIACLLYAIGIGISAGASEDWVKSLQMILDLNIVPIVAYYVVKNLIFKEKDLNLLFNALLVIALYSCFFIYHEWITGNVLLYEGKGYVIYGQSGLRFIRSLWGGPHVYGAIFSFVIPLAFYRIAKANSLLRRSFYSILLLLFLVGLALTVKRAAWISTLVSFVIIYPFFPAFRKIFIVGLIMIGIPIVLFWNSFSLEGVEERINTKVDTLNGRTYRWDAAIDLWKEKPILGHGYRSFDTLSGYEAVENFYLHLLVSGGLVAFLPFLAITILVISESISIYIRGPSVPTIFVSRELTAIFWGIFAAYLVKSMTGAQGVGIVNILIFVIIGAMVGSQGEQSALYDKKSITKLP